MAAALIAVLVFQFRPRNYVPGLYWLAVVLISVVGTLFTDNLVDNLGVPLETTTIAFAIALAVISPSGTGASGPSRSTPSSRPGARPSTGWRSSSPSRSAPRPATCRREARPRLPVSALIFAGVIAVIAMRPPPLQAERRPRLLDRLHPHPAAGRLDRRLPLPARRRRRPRPGHDLTSVHLPDHDPRPGRLPDPHEDRRDPERTDRARGARAARV